MTVIHYDKNVPINIFKFMEDMHNVMPTYQNIPMISELVRRKMSFVYYIHDVFLNNIDLQKKLLDITEGQKFIYFKKSKELCTYYVDNFNIDNIDTYPISCYFDSDKEFLKKCLKKSKRRKTLYDLNFFINLNKNLNQDDINEIALENPYFIYSLNYKVSITTLTYIIKKHSKFIIEHDLFDFFKKYINLYSDYRNNKEILKGMNKIKLFHSSFT